MDPSAVRNLAVDQKPIACVEEGNIARIDRG